MNGEPMLITNTLQYIWPVMDPDGEEPLTRAEILAHAYRELDQVATDEGCTIVGHPLWSVQAGADTKGWEDWPGRVIIALVPVEYRPAATPDGEPLLTRAEWQEIAAEEATATEEARLAAKAAEHERRETFYAEVARLHQLGLTRAEMQRVLLLDRDGTIRTAERHLGIVAHQHRPTRAKMGASDLPDPKRLRKLHDNGCTLAEVARALDVTRGSATVVYERLGLTPNRPGTPATVEPLPAPADNRELVMAA